MVLVYFLEANEMAEIFWFVSLEGMEWQRGFCVFLWRVGNGKDV